MKCPNCSAKLNENAKFCHLCGTPLDDENTQLADDTDNNQNAVPYNSEPFKPFADNDDELFRKGAGDYLYQAEKPALRGKRYREPQKKPRKKALILSIIALILVVAITAGVIIIVNHNTVSAKELEEAKENYLPPAQAVTIDTSLDDPSNDKIQFKYDDRARIISCTYSVNDKTYDQSYTYDDDQRRVDIETQYKQHPIFAKEIGYDRVTKPDTFEDIDGYYIRLDDECVDNTSDDTPQETSVPTEEPTKEPPTEEPTEEPTDPPTDWRELYIDYLNNADTEFSSGRLVYLNNDEIPELFLEYKTPINTAHFEICWIDDDTVQNERIGGGVPTYQERSGFLLSGIGSNDGNSMWLLYQFDGISMNRYQTGSKDTHKCILDDEEVSQEEYDAVYDKFIGWDSIYDESHPMTKIDSLPDYIRNY